MRRFKHQQPKVPLQMALGVSRRSSSPSSLSSSSSPLSWWSLLFVVSFMVGFVRIGANGSTSDTATGATVAGGLFHTCMILQDFSLRCFGGGNSDAIKGVAPTGSVKVGFGNFGQLGTGNNLTLGDEIGEMGDALPVVNLGNHTVQEVAAGQSHTCVLLTLGGVACWGFNQYGQLGVRNTVSRGQSPDDMGENLILVDLGVGRTATHVSCGQMHSCAVLDNGKLKCWGSNQHGMLGLGDTYNRGTSMFGMGDNLADVDLGTDRTAVSVGGGRHHTCALLDNASLKCWGGDNSTGHNYGQLGQGNIENVGIEANQMGDNLAAIDLGTGRTARALAVGWYHTCAILDDASLKCFGRNFDGQLGQGDTDDRGDTAEGMGDGLPAVDLGTGRYAVAVTCGRWHTCVLLDSNDVKCFGANSADDLGAGQLGLEDSLNRGITLATSGDGLEVVKLGTGRENGWIFAAFDHTCVIFEDRSTKCWGLNKSGQLGLGNTDDYGDEWGTMGDSLPAIQPGLRLACPPANLAFSDGTVLNDDDDMEGGDTGLTTELTIMVSLFGTSGAFLIFGGLCLCFKRRLENSSALEIKDGRPVNDFRSHGDDELESGSIGQMSGEAEEAIAAAQAHPATNENTNVKAETNTKQKDHARRLQQRIGVVSYPSPKNNQQGNRWSGSLEGSRGPVASMAAAGTAGVAIAGGLTAGWNVIGAVAENLPWIGVAYHMLNEIADIVDTKDGMQGNMDRIKSWAVSLQHVILQMGKHMQTRPSMNSSALETMSRDVISNLQELVDTVAFYDRKGTLAQYAASRSCKKAVDEADTALRGALAKLSVGQGVELLTMVGELTEANLVVDEKLDMIIEHLKKQDEKAARMELRLAEYSESMAEVLAQYAGIGEKSQERAAGKQTLRELGKAQLDELQIPKDDISYPSNVPFASGAFSEVFQVIHKGVIKAAKKTNLGRLGIRDDDVDRVFGRFVKELYIMSQMDSERVVSVFGAIASPTELTLVMEFLERGSIRTVLDDSEQRKMMTPSVKHGLLVDTAAGMAYLYSAGVEHRDLKSANCLVTHDWRVKISDFGLSNTTRAISRGSTSTISPFRGGTLTYMAPELLPGGVGQHEEIPAEVSDVYSFGVVVWDVMCGNGELPWAELSMDNLPLTLKMGRRLDIPDECSYFHRKLMHNCWREDPLKRPRFSRILHVLKKAANTHESMPAMLPVLYPATPSISTAEASASSAATSGRGSAWKEAADAEEGRSNRRSTTNNGDSARGILAWRGSSRTVKSEEGYVAHSTRHDPTTAVKASEQGAKESNKAEPSGTGSGLDASLPLRSKSHLWIEDYTRPGAKGAALPASVPTLRSGDCTLVSPGAAASKGESLSSQHGHRTEDFFRKSSLLSKSPSRPDGSSQWSESRGSATGISWITPSVGVPTAAMGTASGGLDPPPFENGTPSGPPVYLSRSFSGGIQRSPGFLTGASRELSPSWRLDEGVEKESTGDSELSEGVLSSWEEGGARSDDMVNRRKSISAVAESEWKGGGGDWDYGWDSFNRATCKIVGKNNASVRERDRGLEEYEIRKTLR